jgi:hypothetical protein
MNIIVRTAGGRVIARPDTTWVRKNEDFFPPDFVTALSFTPVLYARISKAGRCVGADFACRHFGETGFGLLLYPADLLTVGGACGADGLDVCNPGGFGDAWSVAAASCMDRTSYLPDLRENSFETLDDFCIHKKEDVVFRSGRMEAERLMAEAVVETSRIMYLRRDDLLAVELAAPAPFWSRTEGNAEIRAVAGGNNPLLDFNIIVE